MTLGLALRGGRAARCLIPRWHCLGFDSPPRLAGWLHAAAARLARHAHVGSADWDGGAGRADTKVSSAPQRNSSLPYLSVGRARRAGRATSVGLHVVPLHSSSKLPHLSPATLEKSAALQGPLKAASKIISNYDLKFPSLQSLKIKTPQGIEPLQIAAAAYRERTPCIPVHPFPCRRRRP